MFNKVKKRISLIIFALAFFLFCVIGLSCLTNEKREQPIQASAVSSTDESLMYWYPGASISKELSTGLIRFRLHVSSAAFSNGKTMLIMINYDAIQAGVVFQDSGYPTLYLNASDFTFGTNSWAYKQIIVRAGTALDTDVTLDAKIDSVVTAVSDARSWKYVYDRAVAAGEFSEMQQNSFFETEIMNFTESVNKTSLVLHNKTWLSSDQGLSVLANIPQTYLQNISAGDQVIDTQYEEERLHNAPIKYISYQKNEEYMLGIYRSDSAPNLSGNDVNTNLIRYYEKFATVSSSQTVRTVSVPVGSGYVYFGYIKKTTVYTNELKGLSNTGLIWNPKTTVSYSVSWSNAVYTNVKTRAEEILTTADISLTADETAWLQHVAGTKPDTEYITVSLKYKILSQGDDVSSITEKVELFQIPSVYAYSKTIATQAMYNLKTFKNIANFNVVRTGVYVETVIDETGEKKAYKHETGKRIILQAEDLEYAYDSGTQTGTIEVIYSPFQYKDLCLNVKNNDPSNPLVMDVYTTNVEVGENTTTLTYNYEEIEGWLLNSCLWLFDLKPGDFTVNGVPDSVTVTVTDTDLTIEFPNDRQNDLAGLSIQAVSKIEPEVEYNVTYKYIQLSIDENGNIQEEEIESDSFKLLYSKIKGTYSNFDNFINAYGDTINAAVKLDAIDEANGQYCTATSVTAEMSSPTEENRTCNFVVGYTYRALFKITDNVTNSVRYKTLNDTNLQYKGEDFVPEIKTGYRVKSIESDPEKPVTVTNAEDYKESRITVKTSVNQKIILPISIEFTDKWLIEINYMEQYKKTPFAVKTKYSGEIRVEDYSNIYALNVSDIATILGKDSMSIVNNKSTIDEIKVKYDGIGKYTVDTTYTPMSIVQRDSDGKTQTEIQVPLSCYKDWCEDYGKNWSILYLNYAGKMYFQYSNDVKREDLYGFFSVAIFDNKVSNLNDIFSSFDATGCMTFHKDEEVRGSSVYKFFRSEEGGLATILTFSTIGLLTGHPIVGTVVGLAAHRIALAFCESPIANDENALYSSYFFFLDGTSDLSMISESGSSDPNDKDNAFENAAEDIGDQIGDLIEKIQEGWDNSPWKIILSVCAGVLIVVVMIGLCSRIYSILFVSKQQAQKRQTQKQQTQRKKKK